MDKVKNYKKLRQFQKQGFLIIPDVLSQIECAQLKIELDQIHVHKPEEKIHHDMCLHANAHRALLKHETIWDLVSLLLQKQGEPLAAPVVVNSNAFIVEANSLGFADSYWHQDDYFEAAEALDLKALNVNYYLTDVLEPEQGATQIIAGSQHTALPDDFKLENHLEQKVNCLGKAGTAVILNTLVWHRGAPNESQQMRYLSQVTYACASPHVRDLYSLLKP